MTSSLLPNIPQAKHMQNYTNFKTLNPNAQQSDQSPENGSSQLSRDGGVILDLDSYSETELKKLKNMFIADVALIRSFVKQVEARQLELDSVEKSGEIIGQKPTMPITPDRENKRKRSKTMELNSTESRKVEATMMMRKCGVILDKLMKHRHGWVFNKPVDVVALRLADYYQVVKRPMDLGTIKSKLGKREYTTPLDFAKDVRLTFDNAMLYNRKGEDVYIMATDLLDMFDKLFEKYEVERQCVIVEERKFNKPLSQEALCDAAPLVKTLDTINCKEVAKKSVSKKQRTVSEVKEDPPMSDLERDQLGWVLQDLVGEYLDEILQIVAKRNSKMTTPDGDGEIELDVHALDSETLWDLHSFTQRLNRSNVHDNSNTVSKFRSSNSCSSTTGTDSSFFKCQRI